MLDPASDRQQKDLVHRMKRLLDADRHLGRKARSANRQKSTYAFYSSGALGSGNEVWFEEYEVFALLIALRLLEHGFPQQKCVLALRSVRPLLKPEHARIAQLNPKVLFDQESIAQLAQPGQIAVTSTDPVFLVVFSGSGTGKRDPGSRPLISVSICRGEVEMMQAIKANLGPHSIFELSVSVHLLRHHLSRTKPRQRGRASS